MSQPTLTIASANLFNFLAPPNAYYQFDNIYEREQWQEKCRWTQNQLRELDADIIGFQEVFSPSECQSLCQALGYPYFATVDSPQVESDYIYSQPVVALASRYPITQVSGLESQRLDALPASFTPFSRTPLFATVDVPVFGSVAVYVCHLKSQRPMDEQDDPIMARWLSHQQRGQEAVMLRLFANRQYQKEPMPTLLVGDFNQSLDSTITQALVDNPSSELDALALKDCWHQRLQDASERRATHYHFAKGNVLDYILCSQEFDPAHPRSVATLIDYRVCDQHLINPIYERDRQASDHAFIAAKFSIAL